jgi:hypothetical protein
MKNLKYALVGAVALGGLAFATIPASAMPNGLSGLSDAQLSDVQDARWACGPFRCWWRPNWYGSYGFVRRPWIGPRWGWGWGWHRGWRHRWWW